MNRLEHTNSNTREIYNKGWLKHYKESGLDYSDIWRIRWLLRRFKKGKLLEIGCGVSPLAKIASEKPDTEVWAIDIADEFIELLKGKNKVNYLACDMNKLPFKDNEFDYVVLGEVIEHSETPQKLIAEAGRVLKESGIMAISVPNNEIAETHQYPQHIWGISKEDIIELVNVLEMQTIGNSILCYAKPL